MTVLYDMRKRRYIRILLFVGIFIFAFGFFSSNKTEAAANKTLNINWSHIASVGNQAKGSDSCFCFALAYCRTILDGKAHSWSEYDANGGTNQYNASGWYTKANYKQHKVGATSANKKEIYKTIYNNINAGRPVIVHVKGKRTSYHWIALVGYVNVTSTDSLSASNFLMIDSVIGTSKSNTENMGSCGYDLNGDNGYYYYCTTDSGSAGPIDNSPIGSFDGISGGKGTVHVSGWALDMDSKTSEIEVHVYIGGEAGSGAPGYVIKANTFRDDVNRAYPGVGNYHGFDSTITTNKTGQQKVYVYAINYGGGDNNTFLGSKSVTIQDNHSFDFVDLKDNDIISGKRTIKLKQTGYGNCELGLYIGGLIIEGKTPDKDGNFNVELDLSKWKNGSRVLKAVLYCADGTTKTIERTINIQNVHEHSYITVVEKEATCETDGLSYEKCSECGEKKVGSEKTIPATGHVKDENRHITGGIICYGDCVYATYSEDICLYCGAHFNKIIDEKYTEHLSYTRVIGQEATCSEDGYTYEKCNFCGIEKPDSRVAIPATGNHVYTTVTAQEPTCGVVGSAYEKCSVCGDKKEGSDKEIPATGEHQFGEWIRIKRPTTSAEGTQIRKCSICKKTEKAAIAKLSPVQQTPENNQTAVHKTEKTGNSSKTVKVKLNGKKNVTLRKGQKLKIQIKGVSKKEKVSFKSSNKKVATVSSKGIVKTKKTGKITITIKCGKKKAKLTVKIKK